MHTAKLRHFTPEARDPFNLFDLIFGGGSLGLSCLLFVSRHEVFPAWRTVEGVRDDEEAAERDRFSGGWWSTQTVLNRTGL